MDKYHGGVVGGAHSERPGVKPWRATFKTGTNIDKTKTFSDEASAKKWRKQYSNKHGRTLNRWRKHPTLAKTVEMMVADKVSVLLDEDKHPIIAGYVWCFHKDMKRIYTTKRAIASVHTTYASRTNIRRVRRGQTSMLAMLVPGVNKRLIRRLRGPVDGVYDNRLSNISSRDTVEEAARKKKQESASAELPDLFSPRTRDEYNDEDFIYDD